MKPTVSLTVLELAAEGLLDVDATVASVLPSFGENGKDTITLSQVLLHAGGFPTAPIGAEAIDRQQRLDRYAAWYTTWEPGTRFEYHPSQAHWVLADMIEEAAGRPYADVITERLMTPAGQPRWLAIPEHEQGDIKDVFDVGDLIDPAEFKALHGVDMPETEVTNEALRVFNDPMVRAGGHPGGGGIASASSIAGWYQAILHDRGDILRPEVKDDALRTIRQTHPDPLGTCANRTMPSRSRAPMTKSAPRPRPHLERVGLRSWWSERVRSAGPTRDRHLARLHDPRPRPQRSRRRATRMRSPRRPACSRRRSSAPGRSVRPHGRPHRRHHQHDDERNPAERLLTGSVGEQADHGGHDDGARRGGRQLIPDDPSGPIRPEIDRGAVDHSRKHHREGEAQER